MLRQSAGQVSRQYAGYCVARRTFESGVCRYVKAAYDGTRVVGGFDEEETCAAMRTHIMRLCTARAMLAAAGGGKRGGLPGTCSIFIGSSLPAANEDQAAHIGFLQKGASSR